MKIKIKEVEELLKKGKTVKVKSLNGKYVKITDYIHKGIQETYRVNLENGNSIKVSSGHRFFDKSSGWIETKDLRINHSQLLCEDGYSKVVSIDPVGKQKIVDISVDDRDECYFGNGILNHNSGKSLLAITTCAQAQKQGGLCIYLDPENAFNEDFATRVGLDINAESFWMPEPPPTVEALFKFLFNFCKQMDEAKKEGEWHYKFVVIVWDSVASTPCAADLASENPDPGANIGLKPRILSKNLTTFIGMAAKTDILLLCLNQLRNRIGGMPGQDPYVAPGGNAIPFYSSVRIRLSPVGKLKEKDSNEVIGVNTQVVVHKTRFGPPFRKAEFPIYFTHGIDDPESIIDALEKRKGVNVASAGSKGKIIWFSDQEKENAIRKVDFKKKFLTDADFRDKVMDVFEKVMTKDLSDPRLKDLEIVQDE